VLHGQEIERLAIYSNPKTKEIRLSLNTQEEIETKAIMPVLDNINKGEYKIKLVSDKKQRIHDLKLANSLIFKQIEENVIKRIEQGKDVSR
jgi:hypothetical protein